MIKAKTQVETMPAIASTQIHIATCVSRFKRQHKNQTITIGDMAERLGTPTRTQETLSEYLHMAKSQQDDIKDVGGYVGGMLKDGIRSTRNVANRSIVTLDLDNAGDTALPDILAALESATPGAAYVIHSTHKHRQGCCRLRYVGFLSRPVFPDEYQAIARKIASLSNIEWFDDTTYEPARLMYWPSVSRDADFVYINTVDDNDSAAPIDVDAVLASYGADDAWKDSTFWPTSSRQQTVITRELGRQQNPLEKEGIIGAFCRVYDIHAVINTHLSDIYRRDGSRYTYIDGSTAKGVAVYGMTRDDHRALWTYSNHATDPASGMLCNAFDLCRVHKFGHMDSKVKPDTPTHKLPSYTEMMEFVRGIKEVVMEEAKALFRDDDDNAHAGYFDDADIDDEEQAAQPADDGNVESEEWMLKLMRSKSGDIQTNFYNACLLIENEKKLKKLVWYNEFSDRIEFSRKRVWRDEDTSSVRRYLADRYKLNFTEADVQKAIDLVGFETRSYHPVKDYLSSVNGTWDGVKRAELLWIDYLGEEDNAYTRETAKCWLMAACTRIWEPGHKFDCVPVLSGAQGIGKSTFCSIIARKWFGEINSFEDQKAVEQMAMCWIMEMPEMTAANRHEIEEQKRFISATSSKVRLSYRRNSSEYKRHCVFIGTTNLEEYLKDSTGNRRWWPIRCAVDRIDTSRLRMNVDQIWAEVMELCADPNATTELSAETALSLAKLRQQDTMVSDAWEGIIREWLSRPAHPRRYDADWSEIQAVLPNSSDDMECRGRVCVQEIWQDCFGGRKADLRPIDSRRIASIMDNAPGWTRKTTVRLGARFGIQKGWIFETEIAPF